MLISAINWKVIEKYLTINIPIYHYIVGNWLWMYTHFTPTYHLWQFALSLPKFSKFIIMQYWVTDFQLLIKLSYQYYFHFCNLRNILANLRNSVTLLALSFAFCRCEFFWSVVFCIRLYFSVDFCWYLLMFWGHTGGRFGAGVLMLDH